MPHFHSASQLVVIALFVILFQGALRLIAMSNPSNRLAQAFLALNG